MKEDFLHYLWQYQLFNTQELRTTSGSLIKVFKPGIHNKQSGPDFTEAKIQIGEQLWVGNVEIHLISSDWYAHHHETDSAYDNVILHVVWEETVPVFRKNNTPVSTLELKGLVPAHIFSNYADLFQKTNKSLACENSLLSVSRFVKQHWMERLYVERLSHQAQYIEQILQDAVQDWEAVLFQLLCKNFGLNVNGAAFAELAKSIDFSIIRKEINHPVRLEALLLGQASLLKDKKDDAYYNELQEAYLFLQHKYILKPPVKVQFFRLRPPNFPTIRLSQIARLYAKYPQLFQRVIQTQSLESFYKLFQVTAAPYWDTHYVFAKNSKKRAKKISKSFIDLLLINTIIPLQFTYQKSIDIYNPESLLGLIRQIAPENNSIVKKYTALGFDVPNALTSQAVLTLKKSYCDKKACLQCELGLNILQRN